MNDIVFLAISCSSVFNSFCYYWENYIKISKPQLFTRNVILSQQNKNYWWNALIISVEPNTDCCETFKSIYRASFQIIYLCNFCPYASKVCFTIHTDSPAVLRSTFKFPKDQPEFQNISIKYKTIHVNWAINHCTNDQLTKYF